MQADSFSPSRSTLDSVLYLDDYKDYNVDLLFSCSAVVVKNLPTQQVEPMLSIKDFIRANPKQTITVNRQMSLPKNIKLQTNLKQSIETMPLADFEAYYNSQLTSLKSTSSKQLLYGINFWPSSLTNKISTIFDWLDMHLPLTDPRHKDNLVSHLYGPISGLNVPQLYYKVPGNYTSFHFQYGLLPSVNVNIGKGTSRWWLIQYEELLKLQSPKSDASVFSQTFWISEEFMRAKGIKFSVIVQGPGDAVITSTKVGHFVLAESHSVHISWNFMPVRPKFVKDYLFHIDLTSKGLLKKNPYPIKFLLLNYVTQTLSSQLPIHSTRQLELKLANDIVEEDLSAIEFKTLYDNEEEVDLINVKDVSQGCYCCDLCRNESIFYIFSVMLQTTKEPQYLSLCRHCWASRNPTAFQSPVLIKNNYKRAHLSNFYSKVLGLGHEEQVQMQSASHSQEENRMKDESQSDIEVQVPEAGKFINEFVKYFLRPHLLVTGSDRDKVSKQDMRLFYEKWTKTYQLKQNIKIGQSSTWASNLNKRIQNQVEIKSDKYDPFIYGIKFKADFMIDEAISSFEYRDYKELPSSGIRARHSTVVYI